MFNINDLLLPLTESKAFKVAAVETIGQQLDVAVAGFVEVETDEEALYVDGGYGDSRTAILKHWHRLSIYDEDFREALLTGQALFVEDIATDNHGAGGELQVLQATNMRAAAILPLMKHGRLVAYFYAMHPEPRTWREEERSVLHEVAERTWTVIEQTYNKRVLGESDAKYRALFNLIDEGFCIIEVLFDDSGMAYDYRFLELFQNLLSVKKAHAK